MAENRAKVIELIRAGIDEEFYQERRASDMFTDQMKLSLWRKLSVEGRVTSLTFDHEFMENVNQFFRYDTVPLTSSFPDLTLMELTLNGLVWQCGSFPRL